MANWRYNLNLMDPGDVDRMHQLEHTHDASEVENLPSGSNLTKATGAEINTGTDDAKYTTSKAIADSAVLKAIPDPLPAVSGENLTNLPAANLNGDLPVINGANLTGLSPGQVGAPSNEAGADYIVKSNGTDLYSSNLIDDGVRVAVRIPLQLDSHQVSTLPPASIGAGAMAYVADSVDTAITGLGLPVVGGGTNKTVVVSDGTNWIVQ
jgi:hypothetical protein